MAVVRREVAAGELASPVFPSDEHFVVLKGAGPRDPSVVWVANQLPLMRCESCSDQVQVQEFASAFPIVPCGLVVGKSLVLLAIVAELPFRTGDGRLTVFLAITDECLLTNPVVCGMCASFCSHEEVSMARAEIPRSSPLADPR